MTLEKNGLKQAAPGTQTRFFRSKENVSVQSVNQTITTPGKVLLRTNSLAADEPPLTLSALLGALSCALDLTEGVEAGHALRSCIIGLRIAEVIGLSPAEQANLHLVLLLKDAGCSSNSARMHAVFAADDISAKRDGKFCDWCSPVDSIRYAASHAASHLPWHERVRQLFSISRMPGRVMDMLTETRCTRGAAIANSLGLDASVGEAIYHLDEHWDGRGASRGVRGNAIPMFSRIACLAQTLELFAKTTGVSRAFEVIGKRSGKWFDPALVRAAKTLKNEAAFWHELHTAPHQMLQKHATQHLLHSAFPDASLDRVCDAFADIVDAKSPFTAEHSRRVSDYAYRIAKHRGISPARCDTLRRAGLLHDLGKLGVSNLILEKPGRLTREEMAVMRDHPAGTARILRQAPALHRLADIAAAHHEKLDGTGYHLGITGEYLDEEMRILVVADIYDALTADRPYRKAMPIDAALTLLLKDAYRCLDAPSVFALQEIVS